MKKYILNEKTNSVKTGFADIDERFGGLRRGDTYLLAGSPGMGKTAFANNIWNNVKNFATGISLIFDTTDIDIDEVYNLCKLVNGDIDLIIIDFLQRIKGYDECSIDVPAKAKLIAMEFNCPVIVLCKITRNDENMVEHRPNLQDIKQVADIEQIDHIWALYRDEYYNHEYSTKPLIMELLILIPTAEITTIDFVWLEKYQKVCCKNEVIRV